MSGSTGTGQRWASWAAATVGGVLLLALNAGAASAFEVPGDRVTLHGARLEGARELTVTFWGSGPQGAPVGPCNPRYEGTAEQSGDRMVVTVSGTSPEPRRRVACPQVAYERTLTVTLPAALTGDTVIDGATGRPLAVVI